jgi:hypothetical protein
MHARTRAAARGNAVPLVDAEDVDWEQQQEQGGAQHGLLVADQVHAAQAAALQRGLLLQRFECTPGGVADGGKLKTRCPAWTGQLPIGGDPALHLGLLSWGCFVVLAKGKSHTSSAFCDALQAMMCMSAVVSKEAKEHMPKSYEDVLAMLCAAGCIMAPLVVYRSCGCGFLYRRVPNV